MLAAVMTIALAACGDDSAKETSSTGGTAQTSSKSNIEESSSAKEASSETTQQAESSKAPNKVSSAPAKTSSAPAKVSSKAPAKTSSTPKANSSVAPPVTGKFKSIAEYLNYPEVKQQIDTLIESMKSMGLNMKVTGEGNKLIYTYQYIQQAPAGTANALKDSLQTQAGTFEGVAASLKVAIDVSNPVVVVKYLNADGTLLLSQEFQAK